MRIIIAAGGTGGHINPGIAIANKIMERRPDTEIIFIGTRRGMETKLVTDAGYSIEYIKVRGFRRKLSIDTLKAAFESVMSLFESRRILKKFKPDLVIGTGGYVCGPVLLCSSSMRIPTVIHEANALPGITTKILAARVNVVLLSFEGAAKYLKKTKKIIITGNPVKKEMLETTRDDARRKLSIDDVTHMVVFVAGSRGAFKMNTVIAGMIKEFGGQIGYRIAFATGEVHYDKMIEEIGSENSKLPNVEIMPYIYDAATYFNAADLIVSRAGSTTSELLAIGKPSILIPSPYVTENHQEANARDIERIGAAEVLLEKDLTPRLLFDKINGLLGDERRLSKMAANAKRNGITDAADRIYEAIFDNIPF